MTVIPLRATDATGSDQHVLTDPYSGVSVEIAVDEGAAVRTPDGHLAPVVDIAHARARRKARFLAECRTEVRSRCATLGVDVDKLIHGLCRSWDRPPVDLADLEEGDLVRAVAVLRERARQLTEQLMRPGYGR